MDNILCLLFNSATIACQTLVAAVAAFAVAGLACHGQLAIATTQSVRRSNGGHSTTL